jgi:hypothetical protein
MAVLQARPGVGASSRLDHSREPNGTINGFVPLAVIELIYHVNRNGSCSHPKQRLSVSLQCITWFRVLFLWQKADGL